jgi:F0F1-type ATP synthase delta subunit
MITATEIAKIMASTATDQASADRISETVAKKYPTKIPAIIRTLKRMRDLDADFVQIVTARELTKNDQADLERSLSTKYAQKLTFVYTVEPSTLGGIIVKIGETVIDNSLRARIDGVQQKIKSINLNQG